MSCNKGTKCAPQKIIALSQLTFSIENKYIVLQMEHATLYKNNVSCLY